MLVLRQIDRFLEVGNVCSKGWMGAQFDGQARAQVISLASTISE